MNIGYVKNLENLNPHNTEKSALINQNQVFCS